MYTSRFSSQAASYYNNKSPLYQRNTISRLLEDWNICYNEIVKRMTLVIHISLVNRE